MDVRNIKSNAATIEDVKTWHAKINDGRLQLSGINTLAIDMNEILRTFTVPKGSRASLSYFPSSANFIGKSEHFDASNDRPPLTIITGHTEPNLNAALLESLIPLRAALEKEVSTLPSGMKNKVLHFSRPEEWKLTTLFFLWENNNDAFRMPVPTVDTEVVVERRRIVIYNVRKGGKLWKTIIDIDNTKRYLALQFDRFKDEPVPVQNEQATCLLRTKAGEVFVGTHNGVYNLHRNKFIQGTEGHFIRSLSEVEEGILAFTRDFFLLCRKIGSVKPIHPSDREKNLLIRPNNISNHEGVIQSCQWKTQSDDPIIEQTISGPLSIRLPKRTNSQPGVTATPVPTQEEPPPNSTTQQISSPPALTVVSPPASVSSTAAPPPSEG